MTVSALCPRGGAALTAIEARELSHRQLMAVHRLLELRHRDARLEFQAGVEGKQAEDVAMGLPQWRLRPLVADAMEVGDAPTGTVAGAAGKLGCPIQASWQFLRAWAFSTSCCTRAPQLA